MKMAHEIGQRWHNLRKDERGASIVEFALLVPVLLVLLIGTVTLFDLFRNLQSVEKATFTVGDMMSRQTEMNQATLDRMLSLMRHMVPTASDGGLRVSSIAKEEGMMVVQWSASVGDAVPITTLPSSVVPDVAEGDSVLLTESFVPHRAFSGAFGFGAVTFEARSAHRPRFLAQIVFD